MSVPIALQGMLKVVVHEARDVFPVASFGEEDPYCIARLGKHSIRTEYCVLDKVSLLSTLFGAAA